MGIELKSSNPTCCSPLSHLSQQSLLEDMLSTLSLMFEGDSRWEPYKFKQEFYGCASQEMRSLYPLLLAVLLLCHSDPSTLVFMQREHGGLSQAVGLSAGRWLAEFTPPPAVAPPHCSTRIGAASCLSPRWGGGARLRSLCRGLHAPRSPRLSVVWARAPRPREQGWPETATIWVSRGKTRGSESEYGALSPGNGGRFGVLVTRL